MKSRSCSIIILSALFLVLITSVVFVVLRDDELISRAKPPLETLLCCTTQQALELDEVITPKVNMDGNPGLSSVGDALAEYLKLRYGDYMTDECISMLAANRSFSLSAKLAKQYSSDIKLDNLIIEDSNNNENLFRFNAVLKTDTEVVASLSGTIQLEKMGSVWKASRITLN